MPQNQTDTPLMLQEIDDRLRHGPGQSAVRDLPDLDVAVLGGRSDHVVVVRTPRNVQNRTFVASDDGSIGVDAAGLGDGQDEEGAAAAGLDDDRDKLGVDDAEGRVPRGL